MSRNPGICLAASLALVGLTGCGLDDLLSVGDSAAVRLYLVNASTSRFVEPNPGLCPQGLDQLPHFFLSERPLLPPGSAIGLTTVRIAGLSGICIAADEHFQVGLCGWKTGDSADNLTACTDKLGGQLGTQFSCGDTVILTWTDTPAPNGTWTSQVLTVPGNPAPSAAFMILPGGGTCTQ
ncbi:MAG: hypothetical protein U1A27_10375 [Phycisphaerae bacterium]